MKHLIACFALCMTISAGAQINGFEPPYNPDSNADAFIGTHDLMELLSAFGSAFEPENIYVSTDSMHMLVLAADGVTRSECLGICEGMGNQWRVMSIADFGRYEGLVDGSSNTSVPSGAWVDGEKLIDIGIQEAVNSNSPGIFWPYMDHNSALNFTYLNNSSLGCYCATQERPKVEYSYCEGTDIQSCADAKVDEGWYPLGAVAAYHLAPDGIGYQTGYVNATSNTFKQKVQAFWRWAE